MKVKCDRLLMLSNVAFTCSLRHYSSVHVIAGHAQHPVGGSKDGVGADATLRRTTAIAAAADGATYYLSDSGSAWLREVTLMKSGKANVTTLLSARAHTASGPDHNVVGLAVPGHGSRGKAPPGVSFYSFHWFNSCNSRNEGLRMWWMIK